MIRLRARVLPPLVAVLAILQLVAPYRGWTILLVGLGGAWIIAYLWARSLARGLGLQRETRFGWQQVGDQMLERFTLANEEWAPASWVELLDRSTLPDHPGHRVTSVSGYHSIRWHESLVCNRRGVFTLGPTDLRTADPFSIYSVRRHEAATSTLVVMPPILPLPQIEVAPGGRVGEARTRAPALEHSVSAGQVREHMPGDSIRRIHWPTSARKDDLYIRLFDTAPTGDWWIVLDLDRRVQAGEGMDSTEEHGVILSASLMDRGLRSGRAVGLTTTDQEDRLAWIRPGSGEAHRWKLLHALALAGPGTTSLSELLKRVRPSLARPASLIVITPDGAGRWVEGVLALTLRGVVPTVLLLDAASYRASYGASFGGRGDTRTVAELLADAGISHQIIHRDDLDPSQIGFPRRDDKRKVDLSEAPWTVLR
ncbi:MAG: DUF58 domain-containing protein [Anaerolineae bacterium]